jgi:hypothetical protein
MGSDNRTAPNFTGSDLAHKKESIAHFFIIFANFFGVWPIFWGSNLQLDIGGNPLLGISLLGPK